MTGAHMVAPGTVVDTTGDPRWTPTRVELRLAQPVVGLPRDPLHLDGPASRCAWLAAKDSGWTLPPMSGGWVHDFTLPLATWTGTCTRADPDPRLLAADEVSVWGWACSAAQYTPARHETVHTRRMPAVEAMALWTRARSHDLGAGHRRAMNTPHQATWTPTLTWWCLADPDALRVLLARLPGVGRLTRHGWGQPLDVSVTEDPAAFDRWRWRWWPDPAGGSGGARAPYWHPSRVMTGVLATP